MEMDEIDLEISEASSTPKYKQLINSIVSNIEAGRLKYGQKIPSINNLSAEYYLSRDTVEKAYQELKARGVIESVAGKGYYIRHSHPQSKIKVLILFNKLSAYKKVIFNVIVKELGDKADVHLHVYHCDFTLFKRLVAQNHPGYDHYLIMPHFKAAEDSEVTRVIQQIPSAKLIVLDRALPALKEGHGVVYQDFKNDIYSSLNAARPLLEKYQKITLVFPESVDYPYPRDILLGFRKYVVENNVRFNITSEITPDYPLENGEAFITIEEADLVQLIKKIRQQPELQLGKTVGILSYNDTPLKEVLADGITVITTDFEQMGRSAAQMLLENKKFQQKTDFRLIVRNSL